MSFNPLNLFKAIDRGMDIIDQFVPDKDKAVELKATLEMAKEATYNLELRTKTGP